MTKTEQEYFQICAWRYLHPLSKNEYGEVHHILPKSCGGMNKIFNLVRLTPEEHYRCHELLPTIFEDKGAVEEYNKMLCAWRYVANTHMDVPVSKEEYGRLKREFSIMRSISQVGKDNPFYGKKHTEETKQLIGKKSAQKIYTPEQRKRLSIRFSGKGNPRYGKSVSEETKRKISQSLKGKCTISDEERIRRSKRYSGSGNPFFGKTHSDEVRKKISKAHKGKKASQESIEKRRQKLLGRKMSPETKKRMSEARKRYWERKKSKSV